jgi:hypothetical protein
MKGHGQPNRARAAPLPFTAISDMAQYNGRGGGREDDLFLIIWALAERCPPRYKLYVFKLARSRDFDTWLRDLSDRQAKARVLPRLNSAKLGNLGDWGALLEAVFRKCEFIAGQDIAFILCGTILQFIY